MRADQKNRKREREREREREQTEKQFWPVFGKVSKSEMFLLSIMRNVVPEIRHFAVKSDVI